MQIKNVFGNKSSNRKNQKKRNRKVYNSFFIIGVICFLLVTAYIIMSILHPVGVIEYIKSAYYTIGTGKGYDVELSGGKPIYTTGDDDRYFVVSSSSVDCFNRNGKNIVNKAHSFSKPVVKHSETRFLLYGQGESVLYVNNFSENINTINFQTGIITADITDSGVYAVSTKSEGYSSSVAVFSKKHDKIFEWFSSNEIVNEMEISKNGNLLALSTLKVVDGKFISEFLILDFSSATPVFKKTYTDDTIYQIISTDTNTFCVVLSDNIEFINYKKGHISTYKSEYGVNIVKFIDNKIIAVRSIAANQDESTIEVYKKNGALINTIKVNNCITDFSYKSNRLFLLGVHELYNYSIDGELLAIVDSDYDLLFIEAISSSNVALIKNSSIIKCSFLQSEDK